jgi:8-oxo-dGTP pyrophosphatase MutT (NUDIX family)
MFFSQVTCQGPEISAILGPEYVRIEDWTQDFMSYISHRIDSYENSSILLSLINNLQNGTFASGSKLEESEQVVGVRDFTLTPWRVQVTFECIRKNKAGRSYPRPVTFGTPVVVIAAFTTDEKLLLVEQYRLGLGLSWEIPRGMCGEHETIVDAAIRETGEELGINLRGQESRLIRLCQLSTGIAPYIREHIYYLTRVTEDEIKAFEKGEEGIVKIQAFSRSEIRSLVKEGSIRDPYVLSALMLVDLNLNT